MEPQQTAAAIRAEIDALPVRSTAPMRAIRQRWSRTLRSASAGEVRSVARVLILAHGLRWVGYELIASHKGAFATLREADVAEMATGLASWDTVDAYGTILVGPAWRAGLVGDGLIAGWSRAPDRWMRRLALVATVKVRDTPRTLSVCETLAADHDDMVEKALSWALRELSKRDRAAVERFLDRHDADLGARVKREVRHKLATGLKNRRRG